MSGSGARMLELERFQPDDGDWARMDAFADRVVFQTREWSAFVARSRGGDPVTAVLEDGPDTVGYLSGLVERRFGVPLVGSPMALWTTPYMGFNLHEEAPRREAVAALRRFAFGSLGCLYLQLRDRRITPDDVEGLGLELTPSWIFEVDLRGSEDELFARMTSSCRRAIATGIFAAMNHTMHFWGGASWREHQILRPNEAIMWYAMRYWHQRGITACDLGGGFEAYKRKYGAERVSVPFVRASRYRTISQLRDAARTAYRGQQRLRGRLIAARIGRD